MVAKNTPAGIQAFDDFYRAIQLAQHATYQSRTHAKVRSEPAFEEQKQHLLQLYAGVKVKHSFQDPAGQIFDCVPVQEQPALKRSGKALAPPPVGPVVPGLPTGTTSGGFAPLHKDRKDSHGNSMACPAGSVPIRRVTLDELTRFETLGHFLRKSPRHPDRKRIAAAPPDTPGEANPTHEYAHASQQVSNLGGSSILNVWDPTVASTSIFSLSQQWYVAPSPRGVQTAEVGWQVYPQKYGHSRPVLFSYWTGDGYKSTGSYSSDKHEFVQYSATCPLGFAVDNISADAGNQFEIQATYWLSGGNWWLYIGGTDPEHAVGYYPGTLYEPGPMTEGATEVDYGGETCGTDLFPPMGSGAFAARGYKEAAYQRSIHYFDAASSVQQADLLPSQDWPTSYTIEVQNSQDGGEFFFFFGGPGTPD